MKGVLSRIDPDDQPGRRRDSGAVRIVGGGARRGRRRSGWSAPRRAWSSASTRRRTWSPIAVEVGPNPRFTTVGGGSIWTLNQGDGTVSRVDVKTRKLVTDIELGVPGGGGEIAYGEGYVWVTVFEIPLTQIDPDDQQGGQAVGRTGRRRRSRRPRFGVAVEHPPGERLASRSEAAVTRVRHPMRRLDDTVGWIALRGRRPRRRHLVARAQARHGAAHHRHRGRRERRRAVLQLGEPRRALQHAGHAQGAAHRAPDRGDVLYSDMGRILCSITDDTVGWHDPLSGCAQRRSGAQQIRRRPLPGHAQRVHQNAYDAFVIELAKYGLTARDMAAPVNFFSKVVVDERGDMTFVRGHSPAGRRPWSCAPR